MKRNTNQYSISLAEQQCLLVAKQDVHKQDVQAVHKNTLWQAALRREKRTSVILVLPECPAFHDVSEGNQNKVWKWQNSGRSYSSVSG